MLEILEGLVRKGQEKNEIQEDADTKELVKYLLIMARGIVFDWSLRDGSFDLEAKMHEYMEKVVSTIKA